MSDLMFRTKGMVNPKGKPRVYFTCCVDDFEKVFDKVCSDILNVSDCAIYYTADMSDISPEEDSTMTLGMMNLFVIPVTKNLLLKPNRAMDIDFSYAKKMGIPTLPIMFESGLDDIYSQKDKFGELQYINPFSHDNTEIEYEEKLKKFLDSVLVSDATSKRIREAFDTYMFLSYRKKDRKYANELMRLIHSIHEFRDIAIWYDEFLTPGESFSENIAKIMRDSKLFAMLVTPNLLETNNGVPNFVMGNEYPMAKELNMEIIPAEMESTDKKELLDKFKDLPKCVDPYKESDFRETLMQSLKKVAITSNNCDSEHNYLIGLAYRDGIDVEVDRQRGMNLIVSAAESGCAEAANELAIMYYYGFYVKKNLNHAAYWQKKKIECLRTENEKNSTAETKFNLIDSLRFYTEIARNNVGSKDSISDLIRYGEEALEMCDEFVLSDLTDEYLSSRFIESKLNTLRSLAILYENACEFDKALDTYEKALAYWHFIAKLDETVADEHVQIFNKWRIAQIYHDISIVYEKMGDFSNAIRELEKSLGFYYELSDESSDFLPNMVGIYSAIAHASAYVDVSKALKYSELALELCKTLYESNKVSFDILYAKTLLSRAFVLSELGSPDIDELEEISLKSAEILLSHRDDSSHETILTLMNALYKVAGIYREKCNWEKSKEYYQEAIQVSDILLNSTSVEDRDKETAAHLFFDFGTFCTVFSETNNFNISINALKTALELFQEVSLVNPQCKKYVEETEALIRTIEKESDDINPNIMREKLELNDSDKVATFYRLQHLYEKGDIAEREKNFEKAIMNYNSAVEQLEILEKYGIPGYRLTLADIYDRIALCYEMLKQYNEAKQYYTQAMLLATTEAKKTLDTESYVTAINYTWKLASFCEEYGDKEEAQEHYDFRVSLIEEKAKLQASLDEEDFLSPELKAKLNKTFEKLDFTPSTFKDGEEIDYSKELLSADEDDLSVLFDTLFGILDDSEDENAEGYPSIITLTDQDEIDAQFKFADLINHQDKEYVVLIPCNDVEKAVVILMVESVDNITESYLPVEDEALLSFLFEIFKERNKDKFDFTD